MPEAGVNERIKFRVFNMPCCGQHLCWVNPRLPTLCPECGTNVYMQLRSGTYTLVEDDNAWLRYTMKENAHAEERKNQEAPSSEVNAKGKRRDR